LAGQHRGCARNLLAAYQGVQKTDVTMSTFTQMGIGWQLGIASGWGTYGVNLAVQLARRGIVPALLSLAQHLELTKDQATALKAAIVEHKRWAKLLFRGANLPFPILHGLGNDLNIQMPFQGLRGRPNVGVVFFESAAISPPNLKRARETFSVIVTGSSWNAQILESRGLVVRNCRQGIDPELFFPGLRAGRFAGRFAIFSGGKLEYRNGQDLVVAAFKRFHKRHDDALLVTAWHNPWPQFAESFAQSPSVSCVPGTDEHGRLDVAGWLRANDLPDSAFLDLGPLANSTTAPLLREVDVALLPSRAEGGTNLVAMECMACAVPVILSRNTGHLDLIRPGNCYSLDFQSPMSGAANRADVEGWGESSVEEMVTKLEQAYTDRADAARRGAVGAAFMKDWSWSAQTDRMLAALAEFG
jgi:glycosyltransferase involved in cell wall biosynthesis